MSSTARTIMNTLAKGDLRLNWLDWRDRALFRPLIPVGVERIIEILE